MINMIFFGIDCSTTSTGWSVIQGDKLIKYGKINPTDIPSLYQKMNVFYNEISSLFDLYKPNVIAIEEVVFVKNPEVLKKLTKVNGALSLLAYQYLKQDPKTYQPSKWKAQLDGCTGGAKKCEVQIAVCEKYQLLGEDRIKYYKKEINKVKSIKVSRKKNLSKEEKAENKIIAKDKKKKLEKLNIDIYVETGINNDIADSIGVALAAQKEYLNEQK